MSALLARSAVRLAVALVACVTVAGCAAHRPDAVLLVKAPVPAQLYVDDVFADAAAGRPLGVRAGAHRIEVRAEGMLPAYRDVTLRRGDRVTLQVPLRPDLDRADAETPAANVVPSPQGRSAR